jgi:hypothetical protein
MKSFGPSTLSISCCRFALRFTGYFGEVAISPEFVDSRAIYYIRDDTIP